MVKLSPQHHITIAGQLKANPGQKQPKLTFGQLMQELRGFTGTEQYFLHWARRIKFTEGVKFMADRVGGHWLIDVVASYRRTEPFQIWELEVLNEPRSEVGRKKIMAVVTMREDSNQPVLVRQEIPYTDFPGPGKFKMYLIDNVLMLPGEY